MSGSPSTSSTASSSRSASPETELLPSPKSKTKSKPTTTKSKTDTAKPPAKYEGSRAYVPPADMEAVNDSADAGVFDWDAVNTDKDIELWLIRVPESVKPKHLAGTTIAPSSIHKTNRVGVLKRKNATFDIWNVGSEDDKETPIGGEEIKSVQCLLPRKSKKGLLFPAPKPITRHLVVSAQSAQATRDAEKVGPQTFQNPPRPSYPKELLKHKFMPIGSRVGNGDVGDVVEDVVEVMDVDDEIPVSPKKDKKEKKEKKEKEKEKDGVKSKGKKRKGEDGEEPTPKKVKKSKT